MESGKQAAQCGHAYLGAFFQSQVLRPALAAAYASESPGTKVCLRGTLNEIDRTQKLLQETGIPYYLVVDSGCPNFFNGQPTITALGFGPATKDEVQKITKRLQLR